MTYKLIHSEKAFNGNVFDVRVDQVEGPGGESFRVDIVEHRGSVGIIPMDDEGNIWFVCQYRHAVGQPILEFPAGSLEMDESPESCARRESQEEIGMAPGRLTHIGSAYLAPGYSTELMHFYLAEDLSPSPLPGDPDEEIHIEIRSKKRVQEMIENAEIQDMKTLAGLLLTRAWIEADPRT